MTYGGADGPPARPRKPLPTSKASGCKVALVMGWDPITECKRYTHFDCITNSKIWVSRGCWGDFKCGDGGGVKCKSPTWDKGFEKKECDCDKSYVPQTSTTTTQLPNWALCFRNRGQKRERKNALRWKRPKGTKGEKLCETHCKDYPYAMLESDFDCGCYRTMPCHTTGKNNNEGIYWKNPGKAGEKAPKGKWSKCLKNSQKGRMTKIKHSTKEQCAMHCKDHPFAVLEADQDCGCYKASPCDSAVGEGGGDLWTNGQ